MGQITRYSPGPGSGPDAKRPRITPGNHTEVGGSRYMVSNETIGIPGPDQYAVGRAAEAGVGSRSERAAPNLPPSFEPVTDKHAVCLPLTAAEGRENDERLKPDTTSPSSAGVLEDQELQQHDGVGALQPRQHEGNGELKQRTSDPSASEKAYRPAHKERSQKHSHKDKHKDKSKDKEHSHKSRGRSRSPEREKQKRKASLKEKEEGEVEDGEIASPSLTPTHSKEVVPASPLRKRSRSRSSSREKRKERERSEKERSKRERTERVDRERTARIERQRLERERSERERSERDARERDREAAKLSSKRDDRRDDRSREDRPSEDRVRDDHHREEGRRGERREESGRGRGRDGRDASMHLRSEHGQHDASRHHSQRHDSKYDSRNGSSGASKRRSRSRSPSRRKAKQDLHAGVSGTDVQHAAAMGLLLNGEEDLEDEDARLEREREARRARVAAIKDKHAVGASQHGTPGISPTPPSSPPPMAPPGGSVAALGPSCLAAASQAQQPRLSLSLSPLRPSAGAASAAVGLTHESGLGAVGSAGAVAKEPAGAGNGLDSGTDSPPPQQMVLEDIGDEVEAGIRSPSVPPLAQGDGDGDGIAARDGTGGSGFRETAEGGEDGDLDAAGSDGEDGGAVAMGGGAHTGCHTDEARRRRMQLSAGGQQQQHPGTARKGLTTAAAGGDDEGGDMFAGGGASAAGGGAAAQGGLAQNDVEPGKQQDESEEEDDMFADNDIAVKRVGRAQAARVAALGALQADSHEDEQGYYLVQVGEVLLERYQVMEEKGRGQFGCVVRAQDLAVAPDSKDMSQPPEVAIKITRGNDMMNANADREAKLLRRLADADPRATSHCVRLLRSFNYRGYNCLVFEAMDMNLRDLVKRHGHGRGLGIPAAGLYATQLLFALRFLKNQALLHADIKTDNILVNTRRTKVKLCDFGNAFEPHTAEAGVPYLASRFYRAPEVMLGGEYGYAADMWALGATLFELLTGKIMFHGRSNNDMLKHIMDVKGPFSKKLLKRYSLSTKHFDLDQPMPVFQHWVTDPLTNAPVVKPITFSAAEAARAAAGGGSGSNSNIAARLRRIAMKPAGSSGGLSSSSGFGSVAEERTAVSELSELLEGMLALDPE